MVVVGSRVGGGSGEVLLSSGYTTNNLGNDA